MTLTITEFSQMRASAVLFRERVTPHLKRRAFAHLEARPLVPPEVGARLDALLAVMRGIGNNINQLARHSNETRRFLDAEAVRAQLRRMDDEVRRFVEERGPEDAGEGA